jgi:hypothetical protein
MRIVDGPLGGKNYKTKIPVRELVLNVLFAGGVLDSMVYRAEYDGVGEEKVGLYWVGWAYDGPNEPLDKTYLKASFGGILN